MSQPDDTSSATPLTLSDAASAALAGGGPGAVALLTPPTIDSATVYRPYLAAWLEKTDDKAVIGPLAFW